MKKVIPILFIIFFGFSLPSFSSKIDSLKNEVKPLRLAKMEVVKLTVDKKKEEEFHKIVYGSHGFVEKIEIGIIKTYGVQGEGLIKRFNKTEKEFYYNSKNQIKQECVYDYVGADKKEVFQALYTYDNWGYMDTFSIKHGDALKTRNFNYDEQCLLSQATRKMTKIDFIIFWDYTYDENNNLVKLDVKSGEKNSKYATFTFDDKKNPKQLMFSKQFCLAFPEKYGNHNPKKILEKGKKYDKLDLIKYTYNESGYVKQSINTHYEKGKMHSTITTTYFYEKTPAKALKL